MHSEIDPSSPVAITTPALADAVVGTFYLAVLGASGGQLPYQWSSSALPQGLTLQSGGTLSGVPTTPSAAAPVTFTVTDSAQITATATLTLAVRPAAPGPAPAPLVVATTSVPNASPGVAYKNVLRATGGAPPYQWTLTSGILPQGLTLDPSGTISGTPKDTTPAAPFTTEVTDSSGSAATATFSMAVMPVLEGPFLIQFIGSPLADVCLQAANGGPDALVTIAVIDTTGAQILQQWLYGTDGRLYLNNPNLTPFVCLDYTNVPQNGVALQLSPITPADETQQWTWSGQSNTSTFTNVGNASFSIDVEGGVTTAGTKVQIWQQLNNANQVFALAFIPAFAGKGI